jgi:hypothetical protein
VTDEELIIEFALVRLEHPDRDLDIQETAELLVRRLSRDRVLEFASRTLASRDELRGAPFPAAVEHVMRVVLTARGPD